jgi:hypothetical protein
MELKRYDDFSSLKPIEEKIDEVVDLFPDLEDLIDICQALDGFQLNSITPSLYKSSGLFWKNWCGGLMIDDVHYFNLSRTGDRSQLEELYFQELIYPEKEFDEWFVKKWRSFSLMQFEIKDGKIKTKKNLAPCYRVKLEVENPKINHYNFNTDEEFKSEVGELKSYLKIRGLNFILLQPIKDSKFDIIVISNKYAKWDE